MESKKKKVSISLEDLAESLTSDDLASIMLIKANRRNNNCKISENKRSKSYIKQCILDVTDSLKKNQRGFLIRKTFNEFYEIRDRNVDAIIELVKSKELKRKFIQIDYYEFEFMDLSLWI